MTRQATGVLAGLKELEAQHQVLRQDLGTSVTSLSELEALVTLQRLEANLSVSSQPQLVEGRNQFETLLQCIDTALRNHLATEERLLPPFLSETLAQALIIEHREIRDILGDIKTVMTAIWGKVNDAEEFARAQRQIQSLVKDLGLFLQEHMAEEEAIFKLVRKAFEREGEHGHIHESKHSRVS